MQKGVHVLADRIFDSPCRYHLGIKQLLKNTSGELQPIFFSAIKIAIVLFFTLMAVSSIAAAKLCLVDQKSP